MFCLYNFILYSMAKFPTLSVLIRSHNALDRIDTCISSVYSQQIVRPDKVFICDDHSTDGTWEFLQSNYGTDPHIILLRNNPNYGPGYTMKRLIMTCDTDYYMLIDDDDYWIRTDVIERVKYDIVSHDFPDKIYYRANDVCNWRLHSIFVYKTKRMQKLTYFSLWCNDDDYTLQTLGPDFKEAILDDYVFQCPYVGHGISRLQPSIVYRYIHMICKNIYLGKVELAAQMYEQFPFLNKCSAQDKIIYNELTDFFSKVE